MIPIFDSLSHPTLTGEWVNGKNLDASFKNLNDKMNEEGYNYALAVGLHGIENYNHQKFITECNKYPSLIPIAGYDVSVKDFERELENIKQLGFRGIKIHPRYSKLNYSENNLNQVFRYCGKTGLIILYCTYSYDSVNNSPVKDPYYSFIEYSKGCDNTKILLMHGGGVELMKYAELVRFNSNFLLDLSLTLMKYKNSSLDSDISYLFNNFDRRICIGTDHPEYSHKEVRERYDFFSKGLTEDKKKNIAYLNLMKLFDIPEKL